MHITEEVVKSRCSEDRLGRALLIVEEMQDLEKLLYSSDQCRQLVLRLNECKPHRIESRAEFLRFFVSATRSSMSSCFPNASSIAVPVSVSCDTTMSCISAHPLYVIRAISSKIEAPSERKARCLFPSNSIVNSRTKCGGASMSAWCYVNTRCSQ